MDKKINKICFAKNVWKTIGRMNMEIVISIALGVWVSISGWLCYRHYNKDNRRENEK